MVKGDLVLPHSYDQLIKACLCMCGFYGMSLLMDIHAKFKLKLNVTVRLQMN
jgi:hypothetical protein